MAHMLRIAVLLLFVYHVRAQTRECPPMTRDILLSTDNARQSNLLVQTYNPSVNPIDPFIVVEEGDINIVCQAVASKRNTYRYVSVVVRQVCNGFICSAGTDGVSMIVQYDFECSLNNEWIPETLGSMFIREEDPEADLDTELEERCGVCARQQPGADSVTHCRVCSSGCNDGLMTCDGLGSGCCTYYSEDMCVEQCPIDTDLIDCEFNCVEPQDCPELEIGNGGTVTIDNSNDNCLYWRTANYECNEGFELEGVAVRECQLDGEWTEDAPWCEPIDKETPTPTPSPTTIATTVTTATPTVDSNSGGLSNAELGIVIAIAVLFFLIVAGAFLGFVAVWSCRN